MCTVQACVRSNDVVIIAQRGPSKRYKCVVFLLYMQRWVLYRSMQMPVDAFYEQCHSKGLPNLTDRI